MYVRCTECLTATWVDVITPDGLVKSLECDGCGRRYVLNPTEELGPTVSDHYRRAVAYSNEQDLDVSSAYSVLLGIMAPAQADILRHSRVADRRQCDDEEVALERDAPREEATPQVEAREIEAPEVNAAPPKPQKPDSLQLIFDFDLGFMEAITEGSLTVRQAIARGDRDAFAARVSSRHKLPMRLAYQVTDNRLSLRDALQRRNLGKGSAKPPPRRKTDTRPPASRAQILAVCALSVLAFSVVMRAVDDDSTKPGRLSVRTDNSLSAPARGPGRKPARIMTARGQLLRDATEVRADAGGQVVEIVGPDPASVLLAYCDASLSARGLEPLEIRKTNPPSKIARIGRFRDLDMPGRVQAIRIRKDVRTGRWVAGDGSAPILVLEVPDPATRIDDDPLETG